MDWQQISFVILILGINLSFESLSESSIDENIAKICHEDQVGKFTEERRALDFPSAMAKFTQSIYLSLLESSESPNFIFSPLSIHSAMSMLFLGSTPDSKTHDELQVALGNLNNPCIVSLLYREVIQSYKEQDSFVYGNRIWLKEDINVTEDYKKDVEENFDASIEKVNFREPVSVAMVNNWVSNITNDKITQLVEEFSPETKFFLANALYFNEKWKYPFTEETPLGEEIFADFKVGKDTKNVKMMELTSTELVYGEISTNGNEMEVVTVPYKNDDFEMQIILPREKTTLQRIEFELTRQEEKDLIHAGDESYFNLFIEAKNSTDIEIEDVRIRMPPFKVESKFDASDALASLGAVEMFKDTAEFGRLSENAGPIGVSRILHRAAVEVTKEGTEGAAATGVELVLFSAGFGENKNVIVDRPFVFVIQDKRNNIPVLVGRVADPTFVPEP